MSARSRKTHRRATARGSNPALRPVPPLAQRVHNGATSGTQAASIGGTALIVTDDRSLAGTLSEILHEGSFRVLQAHDLAGAEAELKYATPNLVVAESESLGLAVSDLLGEIRRLSRVPVVALVRDADTGVDALESGADDYLQLPVRPRELIARASRCADRKNGREGPLTFGTLVIDGAACRVSVSDHVVDLSPREYDLLTHLAAQPGVVFSREDLLADVWGSSSAWQDPKTVTEHIYRLRGKLELDPSRPQLLVTVRGKGYRFETSNGNGSSH